MSGISVVGLSKSYPSARVLDGLDLGVPDGALLAVLGESGSGKTTLLRLIAGFERPDAGTIRIGEDLVDGGRRYVAPEHRRIGYVPQEGALFPHLDVARNIAFGLRRSDRGRGRVAELLDLVGMAGLGRRYPHELSGGQQQRVALARALAPSPRVVLLDEPFSALDATLRASIRADVLEILRSSGITTVLVTHDQEEALSSADLVGVIITGRVRQLAQPAELYARPADAELARFLGDANLVEGLAGSGTVHTAFGELALSGADAGLEGPVLVLVRPEQLRLAPGGPGGPGKARGEPSGRVLRREYYGHDSVVSVEVACHDEPVRVRLAGRPPVAVGDAVTLSASGETVAWPAAAPVRDGR